MTGNRGRDSDRGRVLEMERENWAKFIFYLEQVMRFNIWCGRSVAL